jgi:hypothetical protein
MAAIGEVAYAQSYQSDAQFLPSSVSVTMPALWQAAVAAA